MNWRHIFDGSDAGLLKQAGDLAFRSGYKFMAFKTFIYFFVSCDSHGNNDWYDTGLRVNDKREIV